MNSSGEFNEKEHMLRSIVRSLGSCIVAYSGGVDSGLLLFIANQELGDRAVGVTGVSASLASREDEGLRHFVLEIGAKHETVETREVSDSRYAANPKNRCYYCKFELFSRLQKIAASRNIDWIVDGYNKDDDKDVRPGRTAARAFNVRSPLYEANFSKADVRGLARLHGLSIWDKPALACLSSRFPHGTAITPELLQKIDRAEQVILDIGVRTCRVRHEGHIARVEVLPEDMALILDPNRRRVIVDKLQALGYERVTVDLAGYATRA